MHAGHVDPMAPPPVPGQSVVAEAARAATPTAAASAPAPVAVSPEQLEAIASARLGARKISRAAGIAAFSGWTLALFAFVSLLSGLFSLRALLLGVALCVVAFVELRGSRDLRKLDAAAPRRLALNQVGLVLTVLVYAGWGIASALFGPGSYDDQIAAGGPLAETLEPIDHLTRAAMAGFYVLVIGGSVIAQGCTAAYYFCQRRNILAFLDRTPEWIVQTLRAAV